MGRSKIQMQKYDKFQIGFWISRQTAPMFEMSHLHLCIMATLQRRVMSKPLLQPNMETHLKRLISSSLHLNFLEGGSRVIVHKNWEPEEADDTLCGLSPGYHLVRFAQMKCLWMSAADSSSRSKWVDWGNRLLPNSTSPQMLPWWTSYLQHWLFLEEKASPLQQLSTVKCVWCSHNSCCRKDSVKILLKDT